METTNYTYFQPFDDDHDVLPIDEVNQLLFSNNEGILEGEQQETGFQFNTETLNLPITANYEPNTNDNNDFSFLETNEALESQSKKPRTNAIFSDINLFDQKYGECGDSVVAEDELSGKNIYFPVPAKLDVNFDEEVFKQLNDALGCELLGMANCMLRSFIYIIPRGATKGNVKKGEIGSGILLWDPLLLLTEALCERRTNFSNMLDRLRYIKGHHDDLMLFGVPNQFCVNFLGYKSQKCNYNDQFSIKQKNGGWIKLKEFGEKANLKAKFVLNNQIENFLNTELSDIFKQEDRFFTFDVKKHYDDKKIVSENKEDKQFLRRYMIEKVKDLINDLSRSGPHKEAFTKRVEKWYPECLKVTFFCSKEKKTIKNLIIQIVAKQFNLEEKNANKFVDYLILNKDQRLDRFIPFFRNTKELHGQLQEFLGRDDPISDDEFNEKFDKGSFIIEDQFKKSYGKSNEPSPSKKSKTVMRQTRVVAVKTANIPRQEPIQSIVDREGKIILPETDKFYTKISCSQSNNKAEAVFTKKSHECVEKVIITVETDVENVDLCEALDQLLFIPPNEKDKIEFVPTDLKFDRMIKESVQNFKKTYNPLTVTFSLNNVKFKAVMQQEGCSK